MKINDRNIVIISFTSIIILGTIAITIGSVSLSSVHVWKILINKLFNNNFFTVDWKKSTEMIVWNLRVPRVIF